MLASARQLLPGGPVEHLVFSDGLASVSVFVESAAADGSAPGEEEAAALGSSSAYSTVVEGYRVIAVGEVPPETVRAIAQSIHSAGPVPGLADALPGSAGASAPASHAPELAGEAAAAAGGTAALSILINGPANASRGMPADPSPVGTLGDSRAAFGGGQFSGASALPPGGSGRGTGRR
jgi:hypothetical protein